MFIISKRNFMVRRADGSPYFIKRDYVGEIPQDVYESALIQGAMKSGLVAAPASSRDKELYKADVESEEKASVADIRPDKADVESEEKASVADIRPDAKKRVKQ